MQITSTEDDTGCSNNKLLKNIFSYIKYRYVRYLMSGFEYFLNGFASMIIPTKPMVIPDRS